MDETKAWYMSRGIWGGLIAVFSAITGILFGSEISKACQNQFLDHIMVMLPHITAVVGGILSVYGRIKAKKRIEGGV